MYLLANELLEKPLSMDVLGIFRTIQIEAIC